MANPDETSASDLRALLTRRRLLAECPIGLGSLALALLMAEEGLAATSKSVYGRIANMAASSR